MFGLRKINPMVRAIGTMGAIAAVAGGVTFATLSPSTVALTNNTMASSTAALQISNGGAYGSTAPGMNFTLTPGVPSSPFTFYIENTGNIPLTVTASIPTDLSGSALPPKNVSMTLNCGSGDVTQTVKQLNSSPVALSASQIPAGNAVWTCTATATLDSSYSTSGAAMPAFEMDFVGNQ